jgi:short-subunit dehydrogenase
MPSTAFWSGRRVVVTGASSGIGAALARALASHGAIVGLCARRTDLLQSVLADCRASVPECRAWTIDLTDLDALQPFVARVESELGGIDVLVNNAGGGAHGDATTTAWGEVEYVTWLNYFSPVRLTLAALPALRARGDGHVVAVSSMAARMSTPGEAAYSGAKAALTAFFEALAGEQAEGGVAFHLVYPALIDVTSGADGDDALAREGDGSARIPAPVCARAILDQVERGDLELYVPTTMHGLVAHRMKDVAGAVAFMGDLYRKGALP